VGAGVEGYGGGVYAGGAAYVVGGAETGGAPKVLGGVVTGAAEGVGV
jgi:hypothetical protein